MSLLTHNGQLWEPDTVCLWYILSPKL